MVSWGLLIKGPVIGEPNVLQDSRPVDQSALGDIRKYNINAKNNFLL